MTRINVFSPTRVIEGCDVIRLPIWGLPTAHASASPLISPSSTPLGDDRNRMN